MADGYTTLLADQTYEFWIKQIDILDPNDVDDRTMLEAISKTVDDMEVRKEATRKLYYAR